MRNPDKTSTRREGSEIYGPILPFISYMARRIHRERTGGSFGQQKQQQIIQGWM